MTVKELYEWAVKEGVENCNIIVVDRYDVEYDIEPRINKCTYQDGTECCDVEI